MEAECRSRDAMEIVDVPVTNRGNEMSVQNVSSVYACIFSVSDYHQNYCLRIEQIEAP